MVLVKVDIMSGVEKEGLKLYSKLTTAHGKQSESLAADLEDF